MQSIKTG